MKVRFKIAVLLVAAAALNGCGGGGGSHVRVKGVVQEGGNPLRHDKEKEIIQVVFLFKDKDNRDMRIPVELDADGTFDLAKGPSPGAKAKIGLEYMLTAYDKAPTDNVAKKFAPFVPEVTSLVYDVGTEGTQDIVIDLTARTVKKK
jgi:hypothetical protein